MKTARIFTTCFNKMKEKYGEQFELLNGLHESQMDDSEFIDGFIDKKVADATIDSNANASHKDVCSLRSEKGKSQDKRNAFNKICHDMNKMYGPEDTRKWFEAEWSGKFYLHNAPVSSYLSYCFSYDLTRLATEGLFFLKNYNNEAPKHLTTFLDDVIEYISFMSNRSSGAVGIPNILIWTYYFWKHDCDNGYYLKNPDYYLRQMFQKFIYRLNQPFMRIDQSGFVNQSIFDSNYITALFGGMTYPDGTDLLDCVDELLEHQKVFMEVVSDIRSSNMFTFPILTYSLLHKDGKFVDEEFARWCSDHNTTWNDANFFMSSDVHTLSNCCFSGAQEVLVKVNGTPMTSTFELLWELPEETRNHIDVYYKGNWVSGKLVRLPKRPMYEVETLNGAKLVMTDNHINVTMDGEKLTSELTLDDALLMDTGLLLDLDKASVTTPDAKVYDPIISIEKCDDPEEAKREYVYCFEMPEAEPYFTLPNGIITHNCRLLSDTSKLNAFINSVGGTALSIGSVAVNTINLMRLYYESNGSKKKFFENLRETTTLCCKVLHVVRHIIARNVEKGLLPNFTDGGIDMTKCYSTVGVLGVYEAVSAFGLTTKDEFGNIFYTDEGIEFASEIFNVINDVKDNFPVDFSFNVESVPKMCGDKVA